MYCPICGKEVEKYGRRKDDIRKPGWMFCNVHGWLQYESQAKEEIEDLSSGTQKQTIDLEQKETEEIVIEKGKPSFITGLAVSAVVAIAILGLILGYLTWKSKTGENRKIKSISAPVLVEEPAKEVQSQVPVLPKEEEHGIERAEAKKEIKDKSPQPSKKPETLYTVQVGAFRDVSSAEALKTELDKKGFNAYITLSESKVVGKLYKVCIGRFSDRREAETLSFRIEKVEGLKTFVSFEARKGEKLD